MGIKHASPTAQPDDGVSDVSANAWNEDHDLSTLTPGDVPGLVDALADARASLLINTGFKINQLRKGASVVLAAGEYGHDGWAGGASGCSYSWAVASDGVVELTITAGTLVQIIEYRKIRTGTHCLAWAGTAQGRINSGVFPNYFGTYASTGLTRAIVRKPAQQVEFGTGTLGQVTLVRGSVPATYSERDLQRELLSCWRYCFRIENKYALNDSTWRFLLPGVAGGGSPVTGFCHINLPTPMFTAPNVVLDNFATNGYANWNVYDVINGANRALVYIGKNLVSGSGFVLVDVSFGSGMQAGMPFYLHQNGNQDSVRFEARLRTLLHWDATVLSLRMDDDEETGVLPVLVDDTGINTPVLKGSAAVVANAFDVSRLPVLRTNGSDGNAVRIPITNAGDPILLGSQTDWTISVDIFMRAGNGYLFSMSGGYGYAWSDIAVFVNGSLQPLIALRSEAAGIAGTGPDISNYEIAGTLPSNTWARFQLRRKGSYFDCQIDGSVVWFKTDARLIPETVNLNGFSLHGGSYSDAGDYPKECINADSKNWLVLRGVAVDTWPAANKLPAIG